VENNLSKKNSLLFTETHGKRALHMES